MSYGFEVYRANGALQLSSNDIGMVMNVAVTIPAGTGGVQFQYPEWAGRSVFCIVVALTAAGWVASPTISYPGGIPTLDFQRRPGDYTGLVFIQ